MHALLSVALSLLSVQNCTAWAPAMHWRVVCASGARNLLINDEPDRARREWRFNDSDAIRRFEDEIARFANQPSMLAMVVGLSPDFDKIEDSNITDSHGSKKNGMLVFANASRLITEYKLVFPLKITIGFVRSISEFSILDMHASVRFCKSECCDESVHETMEEPLVSQGHKMSGTCHAVRVTGMGVCDGEYELLAGAKNLRSGHFKGGVVYINRDTDTFALPCQMLVDGSISTGWVFLEAHYERIYGTNWSDCKVDRSCEIHGCLGLHVSENFGVAELGSVAVNRFRNGLSREMEYGGTVACIHSGNTPRWPNESSSGVATGRDQLQGEFPEPFGQGWVSWTRSSSFARGSWFGASFSAPVEVPLIIYVQFPHAHCQAIAIKSSNDSISWSLQEGQVSSDPVVHSSSSIGVMIKSLIVPADGFVALVTARDVCAPPAPSALAQGGLATAWSIIVAIMVYRRRGGDNSSGAGTEEHVTRCARCGSARESDRSKRRGGGYCEACKSSGTRVFYCCSQCQKSDWDTHKQVCRRVARKKRHQPQMQILALDFQEHRS